MKMNELIELLKEGSSRLSNMLAADLGIEPHSRLKIYRFLYEETDLLNLFYWISMLCSAGIATLGLALDSPAVIIGAMLLSPLMGPIIALGLALAIGDLYLGMRAVVNLAISVVVALLFSSALTYILPFQVETGELLARTRPNTLDLGVALLCGIIGAISVARMPSGGAAMALPGVAIAVALMPPLCTTGFGIGAGFASSKPVGAFLLFLTNLVSILFSSMLVFLLLKMGHEEEIERIRDFVSEKAKKNLLFAWLSNSPSFGIFRKVGRLSNRLILLGLALAALIVPLSSVLNQIKREVVVKREVQRAIAENFQQSELLSREISIGKDDTSVRLVVLTGAETAAARMEKLETYLEGRIGEPVNLDYTEVPSSSAISLLKENLSPVHDKVSATATELDKKFFREIRQLLPEGRRAELERAGMSFEKGGASPSLDLLFITDRAFSVEERQMLVKAVEVTMKEATALSITTLPRTLLEMEVEKRPGEGKVPEEVERIRALLEKYPRGTGPLSASLLTPEGYSTNRTENAIEIAGEFLEKCREEVPGREIVDIRTVSAKGLKKPLLVISVK